MKEILIHIKTKKGKGYTFAEEAKDNYHGVSKFNIKTGEQFKSSNEVTFIHQEFLLTL